jgi:isopentenyldiphosphate isomerase
MEVLDVVNDKDEVIGEASIKDIYEKKLFHRIVHILIFNKKGEMALQLRSKYKSFCPGYWSTSVGGHVQKGETPEQGALRELREELGVNNKIEFAFKDLYEGDKNVPKKFLITFKTTHNGPFKINPEEVEKIEFFSMEKIRKMIKQGEKIHPELLFLLKKHFSAF